METAYEKLLRCTETVKRLSEGFSPAIGLILGTGLNGSAGSLVQERFTIDYGEIGGFPVSTVEGHAGRFILGWTGGVPVMVMQGRVHYYEGYSMDDVMLPVRLMGLMGIRCLIITNGSGAVNRSFAPGDLMLITDHVSMFIPSPLIGRNMDGLGCRFPDMTEVYSHDLNAALRTSAAELGIGLREGVYAQLTGPQYETPFEVRLLEKLGVDAVGMSTVCEAIAANHMGIKICGISSIGNMGAGIEKGPLTHDMTRPRDNSGFERLISRSIAKIAALAG